MSLFKSRLSGVGACVMVLSLLVLAAPPAQAADPCGPGSNEIVCENSKPGAPASEWDITGSGESTIQGFATDMSVNRGARINFKIKSSGAFDVTIYRTGYYNGDGARQIASLGAGTLVTQPACLTDTSTGLVDCGNWTVNSGWDVPPTAVSGVYVALLKQTSTGDSSHITFIVRDDASHSAAVFQTSDTTWQAYNSYGGNSFYAGSPAGRAYKLSYNRPFSTRGGIAARDFYMANEFAMVQFLEANGVDVSYISGVDTDRFGTLLTNHRTFISVGHDEYWSGAQRTNVEKARDAGVNLAFFGGNDVYWRTRFEPSIDASATDYRTLVCYKETKANAKIDPSTEWTGTFRDPRFPSAIGSNQPENGLIGTRFISNSGEFAIKVPSDYAALRFWRGTSVATLTGHPNRHPGAQHPGI